MTSEDLRKGLEGRIGSGASLIELHALLREFAEQGGSRDEARVLLDEMRAVATSEQQEDTILELLDFVHGFCSPHLRVWSSTS